MKRIACLLVAVALVCVASDARAEDTGTIPHDTLAALGLSDLKVMSDDEGQQVRGQGAVAFGFGGAVSKGFFGGSFSFNAYGATGNNLAAGANASIASGPFGTFWSAGGSIAVSK